MLAASLALWVVAQVPPSSLHALRSSERISVEADHVRYDTEEHTVHAEGHVWLHSDAASLRADVIDYDADAHFARARGHVTLVSDLSTAVADGVEIHLDTLDTRIDHGLVFQKKKGTDGQKLREATSLEQLSRIGTTTLALRGERIEKRGDQEYRVEELDFTPCDCDPLAPHWKIRSRLASVTPGDHAVLQWPVVYIYGVPVLPLPALYVPLEDRKTGLLVPNVTGSSVNGLGITAPVFVTLGKSFDLTFTPNYYFGVEDSKNDYGVRGPSLETEFRYVPRTWLRGGVTLGLLYDLRAQRTPNTTVVGAGLPPEQRYLAGTHRGLRYDFAWQHAQDLGNGWHARADVAFVSDTWLPKETSTDLLSSLAEFSRSTASVSRTTQNSWLGLDVVARQDLRYGFNLFDDDKQQFGNAPRFGPNPLARLPAITWGIPEVRLLGPVVASLQIETQRLSPLKRNTEDDGIGGLYFLDSAYDRTQHPYPPNSPDPRSGMGDGVWQPGEREARDRLDLHPMLAANLGVGGWLRARPSLALRDDFYLGEVSGLVQHRGYLLGGLDLSTELSREFKTQGGTVRHAIQPGFSARYVPRVFGTPLQLDDEVDRALSPSLDRRWGMLQAVASVRQTLTRKSGALRDELAMLDLGQELSREAMGWLGDSYVRARVRLPPFVTLNGEVRGDLNARWVTQTTASALLEDRRHDRLLLAYDGLLEGGSRRERQGIDELVGAPYGFTDLTFDPVKYPGGTQFALPQGCDPNRPTSTDCQPLRFSHHLGLGATVQLPFGLGLSYRTDLGPLPGSSRPQALAFQQHVGTVVFKPACDCWELDASVVYREQYNTPYGAVPASGFSYKFNFTVAHFGSFGN